MTRPMTLPPAAAPDASLRLVSCSRRRVSRIACAGGSPPARSCRPAAIRQGRCKARIAASRRRTVSDPRHRHLALAGRDRLGGSSRPPAPIRLHQGHRGRRPRRHRFIENWDGAKRAGVPRGAYHFVYWCRPAHEQADWFSSNVPQDPDALPPVLDLEWNGHSRTCPKKVPREQALEMTADDAERDGSTYRQAADHLYRHHLPRGRAGRRVRRLPLLDPQHRGGAPRALQQPPLDLLAVHHHRPGARHQRAMSTAMPSTAPRTSGAPSSPPIATRATTSRFRAPQRLCEIAGRRALAAPRIVDAEARLVPRAPAIIAGRCPSVPPCYNAPHPAEEPPMIPNAVREPSTSISARPPMHPRDRARLRRRTRSRRAPPRSTARTSSRATSGRSWASSACSASPSRRNTAAPAWAISRTGRDGGDLPRLGLGRPLLRRAFQPLRQPDPPQRQRGAEAPLPAEADLRRACRRARHERAGRGLRRRLDAHAGREEGRPLRAQRHQDVDHQRARCRHAGGLRQDRSGGRRARHHRLPHREGHARASRPRRSSTSSACAAPTPASWCSRIARCRRRTCSARSAAASTC